MEAPAPTATACRLLPWPKAAAEATGANALLCRVAAYYHDIGKINKADYFIENQLPGQENRHLNLQSQRLIPDHQGTRRDGIELARNTICRQVSSNSSSNIMAPRWSNIFYHAACNQTDGSAEKVEVSEPNFDTTGPRPRKREVGIIMLADCIESAARAMPILRPAGWKSWFMN